MDFDDSIPARFTCPDRNGGLWEIDDSAMLRHGCHVAMSDMRARLGGADSSSKELLLTLMRSHQECAAISGLMSERERAHNRSDLARQLDERAASFEEDAKLIQNLLRGRDSTEPKVPTDESDQL